MSKVSTLIVLLCNVHVLASEEAKSNISLTKRDNRIHSKSICALTGCGASPDEKPDTSNPIVNSNTNEENANGSSENKGNDILDSANLIGSVLEFTDNGCLVNQAKDIEGGAGIKIEAPGMEKKENAVSVTYNPDCEFVIATVNAQSGVTNVTTGSISDVKKQSEVYLYGEFADTNHFNATKVVIAHWE